MRSLALLCLGLLALSGARADEGSSTTRECPLDRCYTRKHGRCSCSAVMIDARGQHFPRGFPHYNYYGQNVSGNYNIVQLAFQAGHPNILSGEFKRLKLP